MSGAVHGAFQFFTDPAAFQVALDAAGKGSNGSWDFKPNLVAPGFIGAFDDRREQITSTMIDFGIPGGFSSMARTVSLPCAIGVAMVLDGVFARPGVHIPVTRELYKPILEGLETMNIKFIERTRTVKS